MRIGELSDALGVSSETIRYYEHLGLLHPQREESSNYRLYQPGDLMLLVHARGMYGLGLSVSELPDAMENNIDGMKQMLENRQKEILDEMQRTEMLFKRLRFLSHCFDKYDEEKAPQLIHMGGLYRFFPFRAGQMADENTKELIRIWYKNAPYAHTAVKIEKEALYTQGDDFYPVQLGFGMMQEYYEALQIPQSELMELQPRHLSARIMICVDDPTHISRAQVQPMLQLIENNNLMIVNNLYGWIMHIRKEDNGFLYYLSLGIECC